MVVGICKYFMPPSAPIRRQSPERWVFPQISSLASRRVASFGSRAISQPQAVDGGLLRWGVTGGARRKGTRQPLEQAAISLASPGPVAPRPCHSASAQRQPSLAHGPCPPPPRRVGQAASPPAGRTLPARSRSPDAEGAKFLSFICRGNRSTLSFLRSFICSSNGSRVNSAIAKY